MFLFVFCWYFTCSYVMNEELEQTCKNKSVYINVINKISEVCINAGQLRWPSSSQKRRRKETSRDPGGVFTVTSCAHLLIISFHSSLSLLTQATGKWDTVNNPKSIMHSWWVKFKNSHVGPPKLLWPDGRRTIGLSWSSMIPDLNTAFYSTAELNNIEYLSVFGAV